MNRNQARAMALRFITDCMTDVEADGYQQHEQSDWYDLEVNFGEVTDNGFVVTIGKHRIRFTASVETNR